MSLREKILKSNDKKMETVFIPEWDCKVVVKSMNAKDRVNLTKNPDLNILARMAIVSLYDEEGTRIFSDDDIDVINEKDAAVLDRIGSLAMKINGLGTQAEDEILKN